MDESSNRMSFLLGRFERNAGEFYPEYVKNNQYIRKAPIMKMSKLTENLLHGIDYERAKDIRTKNFLQLQRRIGAYNQLDLQETEGPFAYPFYIDSGAALREKLIGQKIFVPTLWPNVIRLGPAYPESDLASNILPIPVDQRYSEVDMDYIAEAILQTISKDN